jgi:PAS domain S-box-containing protein
MTKSFISSSFLRHLVVINLFVAATYWTTTHLTRLAPGFSDSASLIWPGTGIALAAVIIGKHHYLPGIIAGAALSAISSQASWTDVLATAVSIPLSAWAGMLVLKMVGFHKQLNRLKDSYLFLSGCAAVTLINATLITAAAVNASPNADTVFTLAWLNDWKAHFAGVLLITPLIISWTEHFPTRFNFKQIVEGAILILILPGIMMITMASGIERTAFLPFPFLIWAALRFDQKGAPLFATTVTGMALWLSTSEFGLSNSIPLSIPADNVWLFICTLAGSALIASTAESERRLTRQHLQEERDFATQVMNRLGQGVTITGEDKRFEYVNKAFAKMLGYTPEELIGKLPLEFTVSEDQSLLEKAYEQRLKHQTNTYENRLKHKDGRMIHALITGVPRYRQGKVTGAIAVITDLTAHKQAELELIKSAKKHRELFAISQRKSQELSLLAQIHASLARELDLSTIFKIVVDTLVETFGYDLVSSYLSNGQKLILQHQNGYTFPHNQLFLDQGIIGRVMRTGTPALVNDVSKDPDFIPTPNDPLTQSELCLPIFDESVAIGVINIESTKKNKFSEADLNLLTMLCEHIGIAIARSRLYEQVNHSEKRFRALIEHNPASISLMDKDGFRQASWMLSQELWGYQVEEFIKLNAFDMVHPDDLERVSTIYHELTQRPGTSITMQPHRVFHGDGSIRWVETTLTNLLHEPAVQAIVVNSRDVTQQKQAEEALRQSQKLESLAILAGGVAHDFNNLLVAMMGQISIAQMKAGKDDPAQHHLEKALDATKRAENLTQQLLAYSGRVRFQVDRFNLNDFILEHIAFFRITLPDTITLTPQLHNPPPLIEADMSQIKQVIVNLIINAAESIWKQTGTIILATGMTAVNKSIQTTWSHQELVPLPGKYVTLTISDDGAGMDEDTLSKVFDPFFSTKFIGRGLGLAAVQGIIRGHSGGINITSHVGKGSAFQLFLPAAQH